MIGFVKGRNLGKLLMYTTLGPSIKFKHEAVLTNEA